LSKDHPELIKRCIKSIEEHVRYESLEIIIGDTGSTDRRVIKFYDTLKSPKYKVIKNLEYHFSKANNELADIASGEFLLFMNNDVFLSWDVVSRAMEYAVCYNIGSIGCRLVFPETGLIEHDGQVLFNSKGIVTPGHLNLFKDPDPLDTTPIKVHGVTGAFLLTPKCLFKHIGGFNPKYRDLYQDCDYSMKVLSSGLRNIVIRDLPTFHMGSATRGKTHSRDPIMKQDKALFQRTWNEAVPGIIKRPKPYLTVITAVTNPKLYSNMLGSLLIGGGSSDIEVIPINNRDLRYNIPQALNRAHTFASGKYIMYCHQDVLFSPGWYRNVKAVIKAIKNFGVLGFEGIDKNGHPHSCKQMSETQFKQILTLDELAIIVPNDDIRFSEKLTWHFYGADICFKYDTRGIKNFICGCRVNHLSNGRVNIINSPEIMKRDARILWKMWSNAYDMVRTTTTTFRQGEIEFQICSDLLGTISA